MKTAFVSLFTLAVGALTAGCGVETGSAEDLGQDQEAVIGTDTFLYFRSNATGWGVDDATRFVPFVAGLWVKRADVTQPWMVTGGDTAIVTETNQLNGWGTSQVFSGPVPKSMLESAGVSAPLVVQPPGGDSHFNVQYSTQGPHRVVYNGNVSPPTLFIQPITCPNCPSELHCVIMDNTIPTCG